MRCLHDSLRAPEPAWAPLAAPEAVPRAETGAPLAPDGAAPRPGDTRAFVARLDAAAKRVLDVVGALVLLILLAPLLLLIALAVRLDSPGPALFRQTRAGRHGRPFQMLKFRSMYVDADERVHAAYMRERIRHGLPLFKLQHDPRITRVGRWLRATSLDELPQLINVLRGEMSLVGPRPALPYEVELYDDQVRRRLEVLPGITGLAQVCSRGRGTLSEYTRYDLEYVERRSLWLDLWILARTIPAVLRREGAG
jgi:exopolysaccharide biosynthesis polyprenyl glycosylphosphotransferase